MNIDKRSGRRFGPPTTKRLITFLDDMNLPYVETYGTQNAIALLTQIVGYGTFFDRVDLGFRKEVRSGEKVQLTTFNQMSTCRTVSPCRNGRLDVSGGRSCGRRRRSLTCMPRAQNTYTYRVCCSRYTKESPGFTRADPTSGTKHPYPVHFNISLSCIPTSLASLYCSQIVDVQFLSAMNPTAGSFEICERLQRHFATFACQMPSVSDLKLVYSSILSGHMLGWGDSINTMCARVVDASILIHSMVSYSLGKRRKQWVPSIQHSIAGRGASPSLFVIAVLSDHVSHRHLLIVSWGKSHSFHVGFRALNTILCLPSRFFFSLFSTLPTISLKIAPQDRYDKINLASLSPLWLYVDSTRCLPSSCRRRSSSPTTGTCGNSPTFSKDCVRHDEGSLH